jgi:hypothetical protein
MEASWSEVTAGKLYLVHDEVFSGKRVTADTWSHAGYDRRVYNQWRDIPRDQLVQAICAELESATPETLARYSLEVQMWWRDHQAADRDRIKKEEAKAAANQARASGLAKLTPEERQALGL